MIKGKKVRATMEMWVRSKRCHRTFSVWKRESKKDKFWIPKYVADAYDGKVLWLLISEEDILGKYHHGSEPPGDQYTRDSEHSSLRPMDKKLRTILTMKRESD